MKGSKKSLAHWIRALGLDDRSSGGVTRYESSVSKKLVSQLLFKSAYGPLPPVRLPSKSPHGSAPSATFQLAPPETDSTVQPAGSTPPSKLSERTGGPKAPGP